MTMRKGLVVGINYYDHVPHLYGCVSDAYAVKAALDRNSDGTLNFDNKLLTGTGPAEPVIRSQLRDNIQELFLGECETALFYYSGHGHIESTGGYIVASDATTGNDGIPLSEVISFANQSSARNRIIVLDSCYAGIIGASATSSTNSELKDGTTILTASTAEQYASEINGVGVFTNLFVDALNGAAGNLVGDVTPGSVYAHIDQSLGPWDSRPVFKTNVKSFVSLRKVQPPIALSELQRIAEFFPRAGYEFLLDPSYEPERPQTPDLGVPPPDEIHTAIFAILQKYNRVGLLIPNDAPHMWHAAMENKSCKLTVLGEHYRRLVADGRI